MRRLVAPALAVLGGLVLLALAGHGAASAQTPGTALTANRLPVPAPGAFTYGRAGTDDVEALVLAQRFRVAAVYLIDLESERYFTYIPGAPPFANSLTPGLLQPDGFVVLRRAEQDDTASVFESAQVVSYYGHPDVPAMGALGQHSPETAVVRLRALAAQYDALNGPLRVVPAFHVIVAVGQPFPAADGTYLSRLRHEAIQQYVDVARREGMLVFLDIQVGWSTPVAELQRLERFLREPFVHVALDPEFATRPEGTVPGESIGSLNAFDVNAAQEYLATIVRQYGLPPKVLVLHQFIDDMLLQTASFADVAEVEVLIDMDGFGPRGAKLSKYDLFALGPYAERAGIKLFFDWDVDLLQPVDLQALPTPPHLVIYQ